MKAATNEVVSDLDLKARQAFSEHDYSAAIKYYSELIKLGDLGSYCQRSVVYHFLHQDVEAFSDAEQAVKLTHSADAYGWRGTLYEFSKNDKKTALENYMTAAAINPNDGGIYETIGGVYLEMLSNKLAIVNFQMAVNNYIKTTNNAINLGRVYSGLALLWYRSGEMDNAYTAFSNALQFNPVFDKAWLGRGIVSVSLGKYQQAIADYNQAILAGNANAMFQLSWLYATCPVDNIRNGRKSLEFARMACKSTGAKDFYVEAIAAGLAEYGKYDAAANLESRFIGALISEDAKKKAKVRLDLYLSHKPCRDVEFYHIF